MEIKIALPSKGRISDPAVELLSKAGIGLKDAVNRRLFAETYDDQISVMFTRAADIPEFVADGAADMGMTGLDLIEEKEATVEILEDLNFGRSKLVLAAPEDSDIKELEDVNDGSIVATEFPHLTERYFKNQGIPVKIVELSGSTEIAPFIGVSDLITDLTSTGTTLKMNHLQMVDTILESSVHLIANPDSYQSKREKIDEIQTGVKGVLDAEGKKLVMMNVDKEVLDEVKNAMPGMTGPTVSQVLSNKGVVAVHAVVNEQEVFQVVNRLKRIGARDILVVPIERII
ncbi:MULTISPECIES: ATP phosphoribosyltransferase [Methanobacterium]|jgi:ATP phosphoribosyltransferase|uniref:ATP phosphoribosyltransferase n=1 Tax=Methanobacterium subterraneum TaxID=59277 RepID=A0A2H4VSA3_9EURY|nr:MULTISPECIES: ATP phosphoribosyltransferase [Methanobacterium]AUB57858.1 ATP phosphoribosyltransferase [Methanobacterium sp. MZ-A1]AUB60984.1 ATP phosphoribosyltransferase [Methanobacterium subterraneum]MBW4256442.1 ATP phosphoribosyltransferase [Methanobacterium sp. YSL]NMO10424.1 ATP phosphoribosyltransferase [Methanobacterium subterraneum]